MGRTVGAMGLPPARKGETQQPQHPAARTYTPHAIKTSGQTRTDGKDTRYGDATAPRPYTAKRVHEIDNRIGTKYANRHFGTERIFEKGDRIGFIYKKYERGAKRTATRNGDRWFSLRSTAEPDAPWPI